MQIEHGATALTETDVHTWVEKYLLAWRTNAAGDIAALFSETAEYHEAPNRTSWIGRAAIVAGWQSRWGWQQGGWTFEWSLRSRDGRTAVIAGVGHYVELGDFDNLWTVVFDKDGRCTRFDMLNTEQG